MASKRRSLNARRKWAWADRRCCLGMSEAMEVVPRTVAVRGQFWQGVESAAHSGEHGYNSEGT